MILKNKSTYLQLAGLVLASFFMLSGCDSHSTQRSKVFLDIEDDFSRVAVESAPVILPKEYKDYLQVFVLNDSGKVRSGQFPIAGTYSDSPGRIIFEPSFPFAKGKTYRARFKLGVEWLERDFYVQDINRTARNKVDRIYPSGKQLPQNILKFYIHFTDSMAEGFAYDNIHFLKDNGDTLKDVFLPLEPELWSPDMKRFTLLLDPGRIKSGLRSQKELGYPFELWKRYKLVIDKTWKDANGRLLTDSFEKRFDILPRLGGEAGDFAIISFPKAGTKDPVVIRAKRPHDHALMQRLITVIDAQGQWVAGTARIGNEERFWEFVPDEPWAEVRYKVRMDYTLEDVSGNNLWRPFDVDWEVSNPTPEGEEFYYLSFWPKEEEAETQ